MARLDRYRIGIPREFSEIRMLPVSLEPSTFRLLNTPISMHKIPKMVMNIRKPQY